MKVLLTGATGYIGQSLLPALLKDGHEVICCVRNKDRLDVTKYQTEQVKVVEADFLNESTLNTIPDDIDAAYYLIHSMSTENKDFETLEKNSALNFKKRIQKTAVKQVIYLSGIINDEKLSKHLQSRKMVEEVLDSGSFHLTTLRAGIIVGSGSASFEIIRDLVEKLPFMIAPKWLSTKSQPIAIQNVIEFLQGVLFYPYAYDKSFDIGGPDILTYKQLLLGFAKVRGLKRTILTIPIMTPKLSSYWLYFVTSTSFTLASNLVKSMRVEVICGENDLKKRLGIIPMTYESAINLTFVKIQNEGVVANWTDALSSNPMKTGILKLHKVPTFGCFVEKRQCVVADVERTFNNIWSIGDHPGWYYANWIWGLKGIIFSLFGRESKPSSRSNAPDISIGDYVNYWCVLYANKLEKRMILYSELKIPGEEWLEFKMVDNQLILISTFRPLGLWGRMYWYFTQPFRRYVLGHLIKKLTQ